MPEVTPMLELRLLNRLDTPLERTLFEEMYALYERSFLDDSEREPKRVWVEALGEDQRNYRLEFVLAHENERVAGAVAFEYYPDSRCGLITFVFVDPLHRRRGLARSLLKEAEKRLLEASQGGTRFIFAEAEDPARVEKMQIRSSIDPSVRLAILHRLGARIIPIPYVQPPLAPGKRPGEHLFLLLLWPRNSPEIPRAALEEFLLDFYSALLEKPSAVQELVEAVLAGAGSVLTLEALPVEEDAPSPRADS